ncbi:MAG: SDR family NAD(P)-dependent oxidoreductase [Nitrospirae bacterium]|nr:MAG: SDR family NAD(P)-dependent oxidoreductase [Nitrospirota bacterium]
MHCVIIGASRGLGAALAEACLKNRDFSVIGIGRTAPEDIPDLGGWAETGRFQYFQADITTPNGSAILHSVSSLLPDQPACVIMNAAVIESDLAEDGTFLIDAYDRVNDAGIAGLGRVIDAFGEHLTRFKGVFVGISSLSALAPPFLDKRIAYPASKAFMTMALRSLRLVWKDRVRIMTVFPGYIGSSRPVRGFTWLAPTYRTVARKIVRKIQGKRVPHTLLIPLPVGLIYRLFSILPDGLYFWAAGKIEAHARSDGERGRRQ